MKQQTLLWLNNWVVKHNLCPFASTVLVENSVAIDVCDSDDQKQMMAAVLESLDALVQHDETILSTSLLVFSHSLDHFEDYLDFADWANDILIEVGLEGIIQIASFHPRYVFDGVDETDVSHYTNRSPYPILHFLREQQLAHAIAHHPNPEQIPEKNIKQLQQLGLAQTLLELSSISEQYNK